MKITKITYIIILDIIHIIALLLCWLVIWRTAKVTIDSWEGIVLFIAVVIISMLATTKDFIREIIEDRYLNNNERRHKQV